jgi:hypothetical protein
MKSKKSNNACIDCSNRARKKRLIVYFLLCFALSFFGFSSALPPAHFTQQAVYSLPSIIVVATDSLHNSGVLSGLQNSHLPVFDFFVGVFIFSPR